MALDGRRGRDHGARAEDQGPGPGGPPGLGRTVHPLPPGGRRGAPPRRRRAGRDRARCCCAAPRPRPSCGPAPSGSTRSSGGELDATPLPAWRRRPEPLAVRLERQAGQRETRWVQLLEDDPYVPEAGERGGTQRATRRGPTASPSWRPGWPRSRTRWPGCSTRWANRPELDDRPRAHAPARRQAGAIGLRERLHLVGRQADATGRASAAGLGSTRSAPARGARRGARRRRTSGAPGGCGPRGW